MCNALNTTLGWNQYILSLVEPYIMYNITYKRMAYSESIDVRDRVGVQTVPILQEVDVRMPHQLSFLHQQLKLLTTDEGRQGSVAVLVAQKCLHRNT